MRRIESAGIALTDLIGGQVQGLFGDLPSSIEFIRDNKLRALAVTTEGPAMLLSRASLSTFVTHPISGTLMGVIVPLIAGQVLSVFHGQRAAWRCARESGGEAGVIKRRRTS